MRIAACIVGVVGALVGIFFAQLLVTVSVVLSLATSASGDVELGSEFYVGAVALLFLALGLAGAVVTPLRGAVGALLLLISAVGSLVTIVSIGAPTPTSGGTTVASFVPYAGPVLLIVATALAALDLRLGPRRGEAAAAPTVAMTPAGVAPALAVLAAAVPMRVLNEPLASSGSSAQVEPGTRFETLEQHGEFVHVRGAGFEGFLPAWSIRRI